MKSKFYFFFGIVILLVNILSPIVSIALADDSTATPSAEIVSIPVPTDTPTPSTTPTNTILPSETPDPTPTIEPLPQDSSQNQTPAETPTPTPNSSVNSPAPIASVPVNTIWTVNSDSAITTNPVTLNVPYVTPQNDKVSVTFTKLPDNPGKLTIREITLTPEQITKTGALSDKAYDITSDMADGTFAYTLSLPVPQSTQPVTQNVKIKYAENLDGLSSAQTINEEKQINSDSVTVSDINHFTIFVVSSVTDPSCGSSVGSSVGGVTIQGSDQCYSTIQAAINAASPGDTINVADGTYTENLIIDKALTLDGQSRTGTIIDAGSVPGAIAVVVTADDVNLQDLHLQAEPAVAQQRGLSIPGGRVVHNLTLDNVNITGAINRYGIEVLGQAWNLTVIDSSFSDNKVGIIIGDQGLINGLTLTGSIFAHGPDTTDTEVGLYVSNDSELGIDQGILRNATISGNTFTGLHPSGHPGIGIYMEEAQTVLIENNTFTGNHRGIQIYKAHSPARVLSNVSIRGNNFVDQTYAGIRLQNYTSVNVISIENNSFTNNFRGIAVHGAGTGWNTVHASNNSFTGNGSGVEVQTFGGPGDPDDNLGGTPFNAANNWWGDATGPSGSGTGVGNSVSTNVTFNPWFSDALMTTLKSQTASSGGTTSETLVSPVATTTTTSAGAVSINTPSNTTITGPSSWDGTITLPTATSIFTLTPNSGNTASAVSAIEVGSGNTPLTLDKAAKLTFAGQAGKLVGWSQSGTFHPITAVCTDNTQATNNTLVAGTDCKISVESDLFVWTKHFTAFITYTQTAIPPSGGSGAGDGLGCATHDCSNNHTATSQGQVSGASTGPAGLGLAFAPAISETTTPSQEKPTPTPNKESVKGVAASPEPTNVASISDRNKAIAIALGILILASGTALFFRKRIF